MATVRIYKVAELLDTTSQEVLALLKRDHGIELKSASSTIEEVVARSFVERVARQRNISLPGGDMFAEHPVPAKGGKKAAGAEEGRAAEAGGARARSAAPRQDDQARRAPGRGATWPQPRRQSHRAVHRTAPPEAPVRRGRAVEERHAADVRRAGAEAPPVDVRAVAGSRSRLRRSRRPSAAT